MAGEYRRLLDDAPYYEDPSQFKNFDDFIKALRSRPGFSGAFSKSAEDLRDQLYARYGYGFEGDYVEQVIQDLVALDTDYGETAPHARSRKDIIELIQSADGAEVIDRQARRKAQMENITVKDARESIIDGVRTRGLFDIWTFRNYARATLNKFKARR